MEFSKRLQVKLRLARTAVNKTQQDIARDLAISLRTYQRLESGNAPLDMETLYKIARIHNLSFNSLTNPELGPDDCPRVSFFTDEKDLYSHPQIDDESLKSIKRDILKPDSEKIRINNTILEKNRLFQESSSPLFVSDIKTTVANRKLLHRTNGTLESPWDLSKNVTNLSNYMKAWEISLRDQLAGFFLLSEGTSKHLHHILPNQENVLVLGQVIS